MPEIADFPADPDAVTRLLDKLAETKKGWPVAARPSAARRLGVTSAGARALT